MGEGRENAVDKGNEQQKDQPTASGPSLFEQAMGGEKPPANLGGTEQPQKVADNKPVTIDGGAQERKPPEGQQQTTQTETFGEPKPPGQQQAAEQQRAVDQPTNQQVADKPAEQQRAGTDQVTVSPEFKKGVSDLVDKIAGHMDSASGFLRQRDVSKAMQAFEQAALLVGPEQLKQVAETRKQVQELIKLEQAKAESERDATKLQELKQLERNLFVIEKAPGFTRANAALVLYQDGKVEQADQIMKTALEADPALKDDINFNTRRREIEQKHSIKVLAQSFGEVDARVAGTQQQPGGDVQRGPPVQTEPTGERPQERVEQQRNTVSPTDQSGKSPLEQVQAVAEQAKQAKQLTPEMKQVIEKAIADADKGVTPKFQELQQKQGNFRQQVGQFLEAKTDRNEAVKDAVKRIDEQSKNLIKGLPLPANAQVNEGQYRAHVAGLYQSLDAVSNEQNYQAIVTAIKEAVPNNTQLAGLLDERTKVTTQVRTALHPFNEMGERLVTEINQSANTRLLYAELLKADGKDPAAAQKFYTEAFATNQMADEMDAFREAANAGGVKDDVLLGAAIKQNQDRGGAANGKALEVEHLMGEALRQFGTAAEGDKPKVLQALTPSLNALQQMADGEYGQSLGKMRQMSAEYDKNLPADPAKKARALELEQMLAQKEGGFSASDTANITTMMNPGASEADRTTAKAAVEKAQPEWYAAANEWQQLVGDKMGTLLGIKNQMGMESANTEATLKNKFFSREAHAEMFLATGNKDAGKAKLLEAFGAVPKEVRAAFMNDDVKAVMTAAGVDQAAVDGLPQAQGVQDRVATAPGGDQKPPQGQPGGDQTQQQPLEKPDAPAQQQTDASGIQLNPKFKDIGNEDLERLAMTKSRSMQTIPEAKEAFDELVKRYDKLLPPSEVQASKDSIKVLQQALESGKDVKAGPDGKTPVLDDNTPLSEERRFKFHQAIMGDLETMNSQARVRLAYAQFLRPAGQLADAEKMGKEAVAFSDKLPIDLLKKEDQLLNADLEKIADPTKRQAMQNASLFLTGQDAESGVIKMPINSRKFLAQFYLGTEVTPKVDNAGNVVGIQSINFGKSTSFKPELAFEIAKQTREKTQEILGFDPMDKEQAGKNPAVASLFAGLTEVFDNPDKYNLYKVTDAHQVDNIKRQLKIDSKVMSTLTNIGAVIVVGGALALSRNPKVIAAFESGLGRFSATAAGHAPQIAYGTGMAVGLTGGMLTRHYGYQALTGIEESWVDSGINVAGSLAVAEVGSRMLGKGSFLFNVGDKGPAWYASQYKTTGDLAKVVTNQEAARALQALPEGTLATSAEGMQAIRQAQILAGGQKLVGGGDAIATGLFKNFDAQKSAEFYERNGYKSTGQLRDLLVENGHGAQAAKLAHLPPGTAIASPEAVAAIKEAGLYGSRAGTIADAITRDVAKSSGVNPEKLAEAMKQVKVAGVVDDGVNTIGDLGKFIERDQRAVMEMNNITRTANASPNAKIPDALGAHASTPQGQELIRVANRLGLKNVAQLRDMAQNSAKLGMDGMFPKLGQLRAQNLINSETTLAEAATMGKDVFAGNGLNRMLTEVPDAVRGGILTEKAVAEIIADAGAKTRLKSALTSVGKPFTSAGRADIAAGVRDAFTDIPGKMATRLSNTTHWVTDRVAMRALDPATATTPAVSRARWATAFKGALGMTTTYNSTVGAYDIYQNRVDPATGGQFSVLGAIKEANFPTVPGEAPAWSKVLGSTMQGSVGQAFAASFLLRAGAIPKPIWGEGATGGIFRKTFSSTPISPPLWNNLNAGIFSRQTLGAASAFTATQAFPLVESSLAGDDAATTSSLSRFFTMKEKLKMVQEPIRNQPLPGQAERVEVPVEQPKPVEQQKAAVEGGAQKPVEQPKPVQQDTTKAKTPQPGSDEPAPPK